MLWTDKYMAVKPDDKHLCSAEKLASLFSRKIGSCRDFEGCQMECKHIDILRYNR